MYKIPEKYIQLKNQGASAPEMAKILYADGINGLERMSIIGQLFDLNFMQAKEAIIVGDGIANSLEEYQEKIAPDIIKAIQMMADEDIADE